MPDATHAALVTRAVAYLRNRRRCVLYVAECNVASEAPDAVGWTCHGECILIECKATRADFFADAKKPHRAGGAGVGHTRYYLVPAGLVSVADVPAGWGLLSLKGRGLIETVRPETRETHDEKTNAALLLHLARRGCDYDPAALHAKIEATREKQREDARRDRGIRAEGDRLRAEMLERHRARFEETHGPLFGLPA